MGLPHGTGFGGEGPQDDGAHGTMATPLPEWRTTVGVGVQAAPPQQPCRTPCGTRNDRMVHHGRFVQAIAHALMSCPLLRQ